MMNDKDIDFTAELLHRQRQKLEAEKTEAIKDWISLCMRPANKMTSIATAAAVSVLESGMYVTPEMQELLDYLLANDTSYSEPLTNYYAKKYQEE